MLSDLRLTVQQLRKDSAFTFAAVLTLALGIGANTALFSVVNDVLLRPLPFPEPDHLVTLWESNPGERIEQQRVSPPTFADWRAETHRLRALGFWSGAEEFNLVVGDHAEKIRAVYASAGVFDVLAIRPQLGRTFLPSEDARQGPQVAVISHALWLSHFAGDPNVLGQSVTVDTYGRRTYTIVGVMPAGFQFPDATELWLAAGWNGLPRDRRVGHWLNVVARLAPGATVAQCRAELNTVQARIAQEYRADRPGTEVAVVPLLQQTVGGRMRAALLVLWGAVAVVLLIACANVANLMLARATARQKEIAIRVALGATRLRIVRQLLAESVLLAAVGGAAGVAVAVVVIKAIVAFGPANVPRLSEASVDLSTLAFTAAAALATGILFGLLPAWQCSRPDLNAALKATGGAHTAGLATRRTRGLLVIAEVALAAVLLVAAGLMLKSFAKLLAADRGFRAEQTLAVELDFSVSGFTTWVEPTATRPQVSLQRLMERLRTLPGVQAIGAAYAFLRRDNLPPAGGFTIYGRPLPSREAMPRRYENAVSPGYFAALGVPLVRGRDFTENDSLHATGVAIVNESFVRRYFPNEDPLGHHLGYGRNENALNAVDIYGVPIWAEIVGVVRDVKSLTLQPEAAPEVYRSYWQWPMQSPTMYVRASGDPALLADAIRRETRSLIPNLPPPKIRLLTERVAESVAQPRFLSAVLNLFGLCAVLLAACGIHGVLAYVVAQRRRELGIRVALGAGRRDVIALVVRQGMRWVLLGLACGTPLAWLATRALRHQLYEVAPTDPVAFLLAGVGLIGVALFACWAPARRAAKVDPIVVLRCE